MKPLCLTTALTFATTEPDIDELNVRVLRGLPADAAWPEEDAERVEVMFCTHAPPNIAAFKNLRWLQIESAGFSHLFPHRLGERGVVETAFLSGLDFLILALPLTKVTDGLIGETELRTLPKGAFVLNPAHGPLIREAALLAVLRDGQLGGAALDTHYAYPLPPEHPLWSFPHVSSVKGKMLQP